MFFEAEESYPRNSEKRVVEAIEKGAEILATSCPFCVGNLNDALKDSALEIQDKIHVVDLIDFIASNLE